MNTDGTRDTSFQTIAIITGTSVGGSGIRDFALLPDGKFYLAGASANNPSMARYNPDGTLDTSFEIPGISCNGGFCGFGSFSNPVLQNFGIQSNGKIVIGGRFHLVNGVGNRLGMARLHPAGNVDLDFTAPDSFGTARVDVLPNDKIMISNGGNLRQLNADGTLDENGFGAPQFFYQNWKLDSLGRVVFFAQTAPNTFRFGRLGTNGTLETFFDFPALKGSISTLARQADGKIIVSGLFNSVNGFTRNNIARLLPNGAPDEAYLLNGTNAEVKALLSQTNGKTVVGGLFTIIENTNRSGLARLNNAAVITGFPKFDYDGDGKSDISVFRPSSGFWYLARPTGIPSQNFDAVQFGVAGDIPVPGDYDGDGRANLAVFRPSTGAWYLARATGVPAQNFDIVPFGANGDQPIAGADFDGDGKADVAVFRPPDGGWYQLRSTQGFTGVQFGANGDLPTPSSFVR